MTLRPASISSGTTKGVYRPCSCGIWMTAGLPVWYCSRKVCPVSPIDPHTLTNSVDL